MRESVLVSKENRFHNIIFKGDELYVKGEGIAFSDSNVRISASGYMATGTLFGTLSIGKWHRYTQIDHVGLHIECEGSFDVEIYHAYLSLGVSGDMVSELVSQTEIDDRHNELTLDIPFFESGLVYFDITNVSTDSIIYDAYYYTDTPVINDVRIALNICTYKRFDYLKRNVELIERELPDDDLEVFITDNASEIDPGVFGDERIHVYHNRNLGGTGGFAHGLLRILDRSGFTHVLFMDDDAEIEPESIRRTYSLLSYLRPQYAEHFIAGAMNRAEERHIQHESGARWNAGKCRFRGRGADLRDMAALVTNESEHVFLQSERLTDESIDYSAWWYCCMPICVIRDDNLPVPIFIHEDDVEYSLRNAQGIITMNGICVWHPASMHRRSSSNEYYNLRNMLIVNSKHCPEYGGLRAWVQVMTALTVALLRHRYKDMKLIRRAVIDYLRGPVWLMNVDAEELNEQIRSMGYEFRDVSGDLNGKDIHIHRGISSEEDPDAKNRTDYDETEQKGFKILWAEAETLWSRLKLIGQIVSLNGWLLPHRKYPEAYYMNEHPVNLFRAGRLVLYDDADMRGIVADKEFFRLFEMIGYGVELICRLLFFYRVTARRYRDSWDEMTSREYWDKVLDDRS